MTQSCEKDSAPYSEMAMLNDQDQRLHSHEVTSGKRQSPSYLSPDKNWGTYDKCKCISPVLLREVKLKTIFFEELP